MKNSQSNSKLHWHCVPIAIAAILLFVGPAFAKSPDNMLDVYSNVLERESQESRECKDEVVSPTGEKFLKAYLAGKDAEANRLWALMLQHLSKAKSIEELGPSLYNRYSLEIPDGTPLNSPYARDHLYNFMLASTEKAVGKNHRFYMDCLGAVAHIAEGAQKWQDAENLRLRQYKLALKLLGKDSERTLTISNNYIWDKIELKKNAEAEPLLKSNIETAQRLGYKKQLAWAVNTYAKMLVATNRTAEAKKLMAQYRLQLR